MKSMKQIADELNVTKMTVYNNAKKANVKFQKIENVNYLSSEDEVIVANRIKKNQNKTDYFDNEKKVESNKKIQKLENQLEEERQLSYSFGSSMNDKQNINAQEAKLTEEVKNVSQQHESQTTEDIENRNKEVPEEGKEQNLEEYELLNDNNLSEKIKTNNHDDKEEQPPKKGFWSRLFGN